MPRSAQRDDVDVRPGTPADVAIARLLDAYGGQLLALARRLCRKREDAEDLVQVIFLTAFRKWSQFRGDSHPRTWLYTIAARACQRMHRRRAGQPARIGPLDEAALFRTQRRGAPAGAGHGSDRLERVEAAISRLPAGYRMPLVLKDVVGLSLEEVSAVLGLRSGTTKSRLHRARLTIRKAVEADPAARPSGPSSYPLDLCLDLLHAKQQALDRGVPFRRGSEVVCERCQAVFRELDLAADACKQFAVGELPPKLRAMIVARSGGA